MEAFFIDRTEVTVDDFRSHKGGAESERSTLPITDVDYTEAERFCASVGKRLPTEAEWEKAARGTDGRIYPWGNELPTCELAIMFDGGPGCGKSGVWSVGSRPAGASPYGALDMAGNVWEWTQDRSMGRARIGRGGRWGIVDVRALRASSRFRILMTISNSMLGFRCVRSALSR